MALPKTLKQCVIRIGSLKKQVALMEKRKKTLSSAPKKKVAKKRVVKKAVKKKAAKKVTRKKR